MNLLGAALVNECRGCYHHCFLAPAMFRTLKPWPTLGLVKVRDTDASKSAGFRVH